MTATPKLTTAQVSGLIHAEMRPTRTELSSISRAAASKRARSFSRLEKARTTRAPSRFSPVICARRSSIFWLRA